MTADQRADLGQRIGANGNLNPGRMTIDSSIFTDTVGESIRDVLPRHYPNAEVWVVVGRDLNGRRYVEGATFGRDDALGLLDGAKRNKPPNAPNYEILQGTVADLDYGWMRDSSGRIKLDQVQVMIAYVGLRKSLSDAELEIGENSLSR